MTGDKTPVIVFAGDTLPDWWESVRPALTESFALRQHTDRERYVSQLADELAALIVVDGDREGWAYWTATPKSSPATRRIPVFVISNADAVRAQAVPTGADISLTVPEFVKNAAKLVRDFARVVDPARAEQLDCECDESLPELAQQGVEKFNAGEFYKQHDLFEELWMETEGPVRDLYRAILQVGVAYYQVQRGNHRGARKMLLRSVQWLSILPDTCQGVDVKALREDAARVRAELERLPEDRIGEFDQSLLQPVKLVQE